MLHIVACLLGSLIFAMDNSFIPNVAAAPTGVGGNAAHPQRKETNKLRVAAPTAGGQSPDQLQSGTSAKCIEVQKTSAEMNSAAVPGEYVDSEDAYAAIGLPLDKAYELEYHSYSLAKEGIDDPNPFPFSERDDLGAYPMFLKVSELVRWHEKHVDTVIAKAVESLQDVANALKITGNACNRTLTELLERYNDAEVQEYIDAANDEE